MRIKALVVLCSFGVFSQSVLAEGSFQTGLNQPFYDEPSSRGEPLHVDIISIGEVINVSVCGATNNDDVRIQIIDPVSSTVLDTTLTDGNVTCNDAFTAPLTNPVRYTTLQSGTYQVLINSIASDNLNRFDISVTADAVTNPDPTIADGRLWSYKMAFNTGSFAESAGTDADYFPLVPGGRAGSNYVWKLDLNKFSGNVYEISANDLGVESPNSGYSVPTAGNTVIPKFPIYMGYPDIALPEPVAPPVITNFRFIDDAGQDYAITPGTTGGVQDTGNFEFVSDADGTYSITVDTTRDGVFGTGDKLLLGVVTGGGTTTVPWDGTDAAGITLPDGTYRAELNVRLGEYHFIADDAETSGGGVNNGLTIYRANSDGSTNDTLVYWDDATLLSGTSNLPDGDLSSTPAGKHTWGNFSGSGIGNNTYIDTYVYGLVSAASSLTAITSSDALLLGADGVISVNPDNAAPGDSFDITVTDADLNTILGVQEGQYVVVTNPRTGEVEQFNLGEAGISSSSFISSFTTVANSSAGTNNDAVMNVQLTDELILSYYDQLDSSGASLTRTANITITDGDLIPAVTDIDDDNDGIPDALEGNGVTDTDGDGIVDSLDLDSDNDGIYDLHESGANAAVLDTNGDGRIDAANDVGANGLADAVETGVDSGILSYNFGAPLNTDGDTVADFRDLDSDNDGIPDVTEAGGVDGDGDGIVGTGIPTVDGNGVAITGAGLNPPNTDGTGGTAQVDTDADGVGVFDLVEAGGSDTNDDGLVDGFIDTNGDGFDDGLAVSPLPITDSNGNGTPDYRDNTDTDSDGLPDSADIDDDNDSIPDSLEGSGTVDTDGDGVFDSLDLDSDNDGLFDLHESGADAATLDTNNDGRIDVANTVGTNGLADAVETSADSGTISYNSGALLDTDSDTIADFRDLDTDNDGVTDVIEAAGIDGDEDGIVGSGTPTVDANGVATSGAGLIAPDTDTDNVSDQRDLDSDGDGLYDYVEAGGPDADTNGLVDGFTDANNDGFDDTLAASPLTQPDTDTDGVVDRLDLDSDNDGITDVIESAGLDPNGDGLVGGSPQTVDADGVYTGGVLTQRDTDSDGVFNQHDLDSDNDGIPDVIEAGGTDGDGNGIVGNGLPTVNTQGIANVTILNPANTDGTGLLDPYDLDADGDGIYDLVEAGGLDANNDGKVDGFTDTDGDGFDDGVAATALPSPDSDGDGLPDYQDRDDRDNDGIVDSIDLDDDNDGITDAVEGYGVTDTDGDGVVDSFDLDSDNDGLFDLIESGISDPELLDANNDGRIDSTNGVGSNGLADVVETPADSGAINYNGGVVIDTDNDGVADFRDLDSDNDSIPDVIESGGSDTDGDGILGSGTPVVNISGLATGGGLPEVDTDTDGTPDQRDLDADNDGVFDLQEAGGDDTDNNGLIDIFVDANGDGFDDANATGPLLLDDTDNDGIPDYLDTSDDSVTAAIHTGVDGIGTMNLLMLLLLAPLVMFCRRLSKASLLAALLLLPMVSSAEKQQSEKQDFQRGFYIGAGIGQSLMAPETDGTIYSINDDEDSGYKIYLGMDLSEYISAELSFADLGTTTLLPAGKIDYEAISFNALYYFYDQGENDHLGWASYIKAGLATLNNSATVPYVMDNSVQISLGMGAEYAWKNGLAARLDLESYDEDAALLTVGLLYRFGKQDKKSPRKDSDADGVYDDLDQCPGTPAGIRVDELGCELDSDKDGVVDSKDKCPSSAENAQVDESGCNKDKDSDGVLDNIDQCPNTVKGADVNNLGCAIFETKIDGVNFKLASSELTNGSKVVLDRAADALLRLPAVRIEIQAHTDSQGLKENNQRLSEARAKSVYDYLESKGVSGDRMEAKGYGETQSLVSNKTPEGRAKNRRVEFRVNETGLSEN